MIFLYIFFLFEENYKVSKQLQMKEQIGQVDWIVKMRNKNICLELKMDRVVYFAARRENRVVDGNWWNRRTLSSICSSSLSRLLHCWYLHFHCWALLQGSGTNTQGKSPVKKTVPQIKQDQQKHSHKCNEMQLQSWAPCKLKTWELSCQPSFCLLSPSCECLEASPHSFIKLLNSSLH